MLETLLQDFDFSEREQLILACLLEGRSAAASAIAKKTGLKRPTVYAILDSLVDRGLVLRKKQRSSTTFATVPPEMFASLLESRAERRYVEVKSASRDLLGVLNKMKDTRGFDISGFQIEVLESYDAVYHQLLNVLVSGDFDAVFNPEIVLKGSGKKVVGDFLKTTSRTRPHIREIVVAGPDTEWYKARVKNENHFVKEISGDQQVLSDMILSSGSVIVSHYTPPEELAIKISHSDFYQSMKTVFELLWMKL